MLVKQRNILEAVKQLQIGGVIAYPTEAVYGLGCNPFNELAAKKILKLKKRPIEKGFIVIASNWEQLKPFITPVSNQQLEKVFSTWPGPFTWVFPAKDTVPVWVRGQHATIAVRITAHPIANQLCQSHGHAIISTSANVQGEPPIRNPQQLATVFGNEIDFVVTGALGQQKNPTEIRDVISGEKLRSA